VTGRAPRRGAALALLVAGALAVAGCRDSDDGAMPAGLVEGQELTDITAYVLSLQ
jgi:hypothetical protein